MTNNCNELKVKLEPTAKIEVDLVATGPSGADGSSAYQIWLEEGNEGSVEDFLESLKGTDDYEVLDNKPKLNSKTLVGDVSFEEVGLNSIQEEDILKLF